MTYKMFKTISLLLVWSVMFCLIGCKTIEKPKVVISVETVTVTPKEIVTVATATAQEQEVIEYPKAVLGMIFFDFDKSTLTENSLDVLKMSADYLKSNDDKIQIEGFCDERGTVSYNKLLGMDRAQGVYDYFLSSGISKDRIVAVISNGKEKQNCTEHAESCWEKNRRVEFFIAK